MRVPILSTLPLLPLLSLATATSLPAPQLIFSNPTSTSLKSAFKIPTVHESAIQARRILHLSSIGTLSTVFPSTNSPSISENRPSDVGGTPIGLMDYFADCEPETGNPTILAITIATSFKNVDAGSNITLSMRWVPPSGKVYSPASLPRFSLVGYLEDLTEKEVENEDVAKCFTKYHADARWWLPGNPIHTSKFVRLVVKDVYWIGGFGDRAYIGWIPVEDWKNVSMSDINSVRLPGEKDSRNWGAWMWSWFDGQNQAIEVGDL